MRVEGIRPGAMPGQENQKLPELKTDLPVKKAVGASSTAANGQPVDREFSKAELEQAVQQLNNTMQAYSTKLHFEIHEKSGEIMVKVLNSEDGSVVREIPPERTLDMVAYFKEMLGLIIDKMI